MRALASTITLVRRQFPAAQANPAPGGTIRRPDSGVKRNHSTSPFISWLSPRLNATSLLMQLRIGGEQGDDQLRLLGVLMQGMTYDGERWRLATVGEWLPEGPTCPSSSRWSSSSRSVASCWALWWNRCVWTSGVTLRSAQSRPALNSLSSKQGHFCNHVCRPCCPAPGRHGRTPWPRTPASWAAFWRESLIRPAIASWWLICISSTPPWRRRSASWLIIRWWVRLPWPSWTVVRPSSKTSPITSATVGRTTSAFPLGGGLCGAHSPWPGNHPSCWWVTTTPVTSVILRWSDPQEHCPEGDEHGGWCWPALLRLRRHRRWESVQDDLSLGHGHAADRSGHGDRIVEEANHAFHLNMNMFKELEETWSLPLARCCLVSSPAVSRPAARRLLRPDSLSKSLAPALVRFLVPGTGAGRCGGLSVEQQTARLVANLCPTELVTYRERYPTIPTWMTAFAWSSRIPRFSGWWAGALMCPFDPAAQRPSGCIPRPQQRVRL